MISSSSLCYGFGVVDLGLPPNRPSHPTQPASLTYNVFVIVLPVEVPICRFNPQLCFLFYSVPHCAPIYDESKMFLFHFVFPSLLFVGLSPHVSPGSFFSVYPAIFWLAFFSPLSLYAHPTLPLLAGHSMPNFFFL